MYKLICSEFNVNENWLLNGEGEMFLQTNQNCNIEKLAKQLQNEGSDSVRNKFVSILSKLTESELEVLKKIATELCRGDNG